MPKYILKALLKLERYFNNGTVSCYQKHGGMIKSKLVDVADKGVVHQLRLRDRERTDLEAAT